jgi:hypothetical protein
MYRKDMIVFSSLLQVSSVGVGARCRGAKFSYTCPTLPISGSATPYAYCLLLQNAYAHAHTIIYQDRFGSIASDIASILLNTNGKSCASHHCNAAFTVAAIDVQL